MMFIAERADEDRLDVYQAMVEDLVSLTGFTISEKQRISFQDHYDRCRSIYNDNLKGIKP